MENVFVTGGSRGIGAACVRLFAKNGYRVFVGYTKNEAAARTLCLETGAIPVKADVASASEVKVACDFIRDNYGEVEILINNAGIASQKLFTDITEEEWDRMFGVNIKGMYLVARELVPGMIRAKRGKIVNISSMWGISGASCEVHYSASKAAVIGFTKALAKELGPSGITVNCVAPGVIDTEMNALLDGETKSVLCEETPLCRMGTADEVAEAIAFLASDKASFITGAVLQADGGFIM